MMFSLNAKFGDNKWLWFGVFVVVVSNKAFSVINYIYFIACHTFVNILHFIVSPKGNKVSKVNKLWCCN